MPNDVKNSSYNVEVNFFEIPLNTMKSLKSKVKNISDLLNKLIKCKFMLKLNIQHDQEIKN